MVTSGSTSLNIPTSRVQVPSALVIPGSTVAEQLPHNPNV